MPTLKQRIRAALKDRKIVAGFIGAPLVLLVLSLALMKCAGAAELFGKSPYLFLGLDSVLHGGMVCYRDATNKAEANLGAGIPILSGRSWEVDGQWTHHSCAFDDDRQTYDGFGVQLRWYPTLWGK